MTPQRIVILVSGLAAAVALFLLVRPDDEDEPTGATDAVTTTAPTETAGTTTAPVTTAPATTAPEQATIRITVRNGAPVGGIVRPEVAQGERVRIVVRADVADHVHLHGYDVMRDVAPGAPAQLVFTADITGVFEIELEDTGVLLAELEVGP
jgi:hypothetical protein